MSRRRSPVAGVPFLLIFQALLKASDLEMARSEPYHDMTLTIENGRVTEVQR
jgi:hypothetical protein